MYAVEFDAAINNGVIELPSKYSKIKGKLKVILMYDNKSIDSDLDINNSFNAVKISTKGFVFNRDEANERVLA